MNPTRDVPQRRRIAPYVAVATALIALMVLIARPGNALAADLIDMIALPPDASVHGWRTDWLIKVTTIFVAVMFLATVIWLLWTALFHGRKHRAEYDPGNARKQTIKALCLSVLIFGVVDGNLFISGMADLNDAFWNFDRPRSDPDTVRVQVNAHQWAWDIRQPGPDGTFNTADDVVQTNELRVPVDTPVSIQLAATDVLHSFSLPHFRTKQDAVPGTITRLWFQARTTGSFEIACAQHCGIHHYKMRGRLIVMEQDAYRAWMAEAAALAARAFDPEDDGAQWGWDWNKQDRPD